MSDTQRTRPRLESAEELKTKASQKRKTHSKLFTLAIMVLVIALLFGAYYLARTIVPEDDGTLPEVTEAPTYVPAPKVLDRDITELSSITVSQAGAEPYTILVTIGEDDLPYCTVEGRPEFLLNDDSALLLCRYATYLSAAQTVEEDAQDLAPYGLDEPVVTITAQYTDGTQSTYAFGNKMPTATQYYFRFTNENTVYLSYQAPYNIFTTPFNALHVVESPFAVTAAENVEYLLVEQKGKETIELGYEAEAEANIYMSSLRLLQPFYYEAHADRAPMAFESAMMVSLDSYAGTLDELTDTGVALDEEAAAHVLVRDNEGNITEYWVGNHADASSRYVRVDDSGRVYLMSAESLEYLEEMIPTRLMTQFSNLINIQLVDSIDITTPEASYQLSLLREEGEDGKTVTRYFFDGKETADKKFKELYQILIGLMNSKLSDDLNLDGEPYVTITFHLNNGAGDFVMEYLEYDDQYYAVRREGQTLFLMKHSTLQQLVDALVEYNAPVQ